jgi:predicted nucleic acid-binding protein
MYLLDTDILSNLMRRSPSTILIAKLASVPVEQQFTSSVTLGELLYGAYRLEARTDALLGYPFNAGQLEEDHNDPRCPESQSPGGPASKA